MPFLHIHNVRRGLATNSSSSHSMITYGSLRAIPAGTSRPDGIRDYDEGWMSNQMTDKIAFVLYALNSIPITVGNRYSYEVSRKTQNEALNYISEAFNVTAAEVKETYLSICDASTEREPLTSLGEYLDKDPDGPTAQAFEAFKARNRRYETVEAAQREIEVMKTVIDTLKAEQDKQPLFSSGVVYVQMEIDDYEDLTVDEVFKMMIDELPAQAEL